MDDITSLIKGDGYPTYNFAHVIDDFEMKVTHVMRGEEFIPSTPKYLAIYEALGLEHPVYVTMPPILGPGGTKKLVQARRCQERASTMPKRATRPRPS